MIKYRLEHLKVELIEITRETSHFVWFMREDFLGKCKEVKRRKRTADAGWFDTWEEAHQFLLEKTRTNLERATKLLGEVEAMTVKIELAWRGYTRSALANPDWECVIRSPDGVE